MSLLQVSFFICFFAVSALARNEHEIRRWFFEEAAECSKEHPITGEAMLMLKEHKMPDHKEAKCLAACVFKKLKWIDNKGMFDDKEALKLSEEEFPNDKTKIENAKKLYDVCREVNKEEVSDGEEGCERAAILAMCLAENASKFGFFKQ